MPHAQFFFGGTPLTPLAVGQGTQPPPAVTAAERNAAPAAAKFFTFRSPISYEGEIFVLLERGTSPGQPSLGGAPPWHPLSKPLLLLQLGKVANPARRRPGNANGEAAQANRSSSKPLKDKKKKKKETTQARKKPEPTGIAEADPIPAVISWGAQHLPEHPQAQHRAQTKGTQPGARSPHPKALGGLTSVPGHEDLELGTPRCWILPKTSPPPLLTPFFFGEPHLRDPQPPPILRLGAGT